MTISDNGDPNLSSKTRVVVTVGDLNNNAPRFTERIYRVRVLERSTDLSRTLYRVVAFDKDAGPNGQITYSLKGARGRFEINSTTGVITPRRPIRAGETFDLTVSEFFKNFDR